MKKITIGSLLIKSGGSVMLNPTEMAKAIQVILNRVNLLTELIEKLQGKGSKEERNDVRSLYFRRYNQKARQHLGHNTNEDGKRILPEWGGKEGALLKGDIAAHGTHTMQRYIELFFGDVVDEVSSFTRHKERAGYGYPVFHGMIEKLKLSKKRPIIPCEECGAWGSHYKECPIGTEITVKLQREADEIREQKLSSEDATELFGGLKTGMRSENG